MRRVCVLRKYVNPSNVFEELTDENAPGLCPQKVCECIEYFEELTDKNPTGLCFQRVHRFYNLLSIIR